MTKLYMFHPVTNRPVPLDPAMVALRDKLAGELGYVKRPCTFPRHPATVPFPCWERPDETPGYLSSYHQVARRDLSTRVLLFWPRDVDLAALEIDGGHRKPKATAAAPTDWRDVRHEEPEAAGRYLVSRITEGDRPFISITWWQGGEFIGIVPVTHWMPLPAPPEHRGAHADE